MTKLNYFFDSFQNQKKYLHFKIKLFLKYKIGCNYS